MPLWRVSHSGKLSGSSRKFATDTLTSGVKRSRSDDLAASYICYGTPEVSEAGGELVGNPDKNDSTVRKKPKIEIGFGI